MSLIKILIISDGHGDIEKLDSMAPVMKEVDIVLFGGDFAAFMHPDTGLPYLERLASMHDNIFAVSGNCDTPDFRDKVEEYDMSIEGSVSYYNGLILSGSGGGSIFTRTTPFEREDDELVQDLHLVDEITAEDEDEDESNTVSVDDHALSGTQKQSANPDSDTPWSNLIVIAHNPPKDTALDRITAGVHVGSPGIRSFIERVQPLLLVSGHIHESFAVETLGRTRLVNPGSLAEGRYALAEISGGGKAPFSVTRLELCQLPG